LINCVRMAAPFALPLRETYILNTSRIAFIGAGNMANSLIRGLLSTGVDPANLLAFDVDVEKLQLLQAECGISIGSMADIAAQADVLVLAVKPQVMAEVCRALAPLLGKRSCLLISIAAGIPLLSLQQWLGTETAIVRSMPNTPALVSAGASGLFANDRTSAEQKQLAEDIMKTAGIVCWVPQESDIDAVTALSGSGPAYFFLLMEAMEASALKLGLNSETARKLTLQTALGAALLALDSDVPPSELRKRVTSPGGTTEQAINTFQNGGFAELVDEALQAAWQRSVELAKNFT
jgi:pyrroline-5-carboxylate reductase